MTNNPVPSGDFILAKLGINPTSLRTEFPTREKRLQYRAVVNWLTDYQAKSDATNLDKVKGLLEAFHHLCEVEDWERASEIIATRLNTPTKDELHDQLSTWGYFCEQIDLYERMLGKLSPKLNGILLTGLGNAYDAVGEYAKAINYYQDSLEIKDRKIQAIALRGLGSVSARLANYRKAAEYREAAEYLQQSLVIAHEISDLQQESYCLGKLGLVYHILKNYIKAKQCYQQSCAIARKIQDRKQECYCLTRLAAIHFTQGEVDKALEYYQESLGIAREIEYRRAEEVILRILASDYSILGEYEKAVEDLEKALVIAKKTQDFWGKIDILWELGIIYFKREIDVLSRLGIVYLNKEILIYVKQENLIKAIDYWKQGLTIAEKIQDILGEEILLIGLGIIHFFICEYDKSINYYNINLRRARELKDCQREEQALSQLIGVYCQLRDYQKAIECNQQHLAIVNLSQAKLYCKLGDRTLALEYCDRALSIATELGIPLAKECQELKEKLLNQEVT